MVPNQSSPVYTEPLYLNTNTVVNAFATLDDYNPSSIVSAQFYFQVANPVIQPEAGVYTQPVDVSMSCPTPNAQIRYTLDGSEPDAGSALYSGPLNFALDSSHVIKARAFHNGWLPSASVSAEYLITGGLEAPIINPPSGTYYLPIQVSIATPLKNVQIRYTLDGSEPNETSSALYNAPLSISQNTTLKAKAFRANWQSSPTTEAVYGFPAYSTGVRKIYPNPFAGSLHIEMGIKEADQRYKLAVYNLKGERVFDFEGQEQGVFQYHWDGRDRNGNRLSAGLYLLRFSSGTKVQTSKIMLMGAGRK